MIKNVSIEGFKCFSKSKFCFKNLTLLAGINGAGKSSLIQSLLLIKEALRGPNTIPLDLPFGVNLGTAADIINWNCTDETIKLSLESNHNEVFTCHLQATHDSALYLNVNYLKESESILFFQKNPRSFNYLSAERQSPKAEYKICSKHIDDLEIGIYGENSAQILESLGNNIISDPERIHPDTPQDEAKFIIYQLERWLSCIVRPLKIKCEKIGSSSTVTLQFKTENSDWVKASNMGFGVTYSLPIILAGLITPRGGVLIVENPEAHLHPSGQSAMGEFIGWLADKGVQIILETHSDHVLNGVRIAIAAKKYLDPENANIFFFDNEDYIYQELLFNEFGSISSWPKAFFDQFQLDTASLGRVRRSRLKNGIHN